MRRDVILKFAKINGKKTKFNDPGSVYRKLLDDKNKFGLPLTEMEMAMISYLSIAFKDDEDISVLYNYIENDLFIIRFDLISETGTDIDCETCGGSGTVECVACDGTGDDKGIGYDDYDDCYNCDGTGEMSCNYCNGEGYYIDEHSVLKEMTTCFSYDKNYFNMFELNTSGFISSADYDIFLEDEKTIFIVEDFGALDKYNYQFKPEVGQAFIVDLIKS
jgi:hypothetical protein